MKKIKSGYLLWLSFLLSHENNCLKYLIHLLGETKETGHKVLFPMSYPASVRSSKIHSVIDQ